MQPTPNHTRRAALGLFGSLALASIALSLTGSPALSQENSVHTIRGGLALGGYDPVAYFEAGKPVKGSKALSLDWNGAAWRFSSEENRTAFRANPQAYAPQYGGYCAWATAQNYIAPGNPKHWRIVKGKLYVNYDASVQRRWEADIPGFIAQANKNWPGVLASG